MFDQVRTQCRRVGRWFSATVAKVCHFWSSEGPAGDGIWLLDVLLFLAGIRSTTTASWAGERQIRYISATLFAYQSMVIVLQLLHALETKQDNGFALVWALLKVTSVCFTWFKLLWIVLLKAPITKVRDFIIDNRVNSGDENYDEHERRKFNQRTRTVLRVVYILMVVETIVFSIPNSTTESLFGLPPKMLALGTNASRISSYCFKNLLALVVLPRLCCLMACIGTLLMGMQTKLRILTHHFKKMLDQPVLNEEHFFERMDSELRQAVEQHLAYWSHLQILKDLVGKTFVLVHYHAVCCIGIMLFMIKDIGFDLVSVAFLGSLSVITMEYFLWCHLVDTLQDEADAFGSVVFELCAQLPHSQRCHSQYVKMRASLMIIWITTINGMSVNCLGLVEISTQSFVDLLDIAYTMMMFMINMIK